MSMTSMKVQKPQNPDAARGTLVSDEPEYPYGLRISLNEAQLAALGMGDLPKIGAQFMIEARVVVCGASLEPSDRNGQGRRLELQITELDLKDDEEKSDAKLADKMYTKGSSYTAPLSGGGK
jgi:hypothetical protein